MSKSNKPEDTASSVNNLMKTMQEAGFKPVQGFGTDWLEAMSNIGSEMLDFTAARIKQDVQTQHDLLHAKGLTEIQHIQAQFFQKAMDDYAAEAGKLMKMGKAITPDSSPKSRKSD
ncbi:phasin family protein [Lentibacter sp. XHP0401]|jgi:hypothetical protein|uniref:phasin family protein n=1 Tax=Lentibacter sp. XHP0401 TaxID=2984334 RepID=UPI0021E6DFDD|nr:phasin family protein [Lentibacter sp. XHP0401]MCV2891901.1 phasin family protein [Lentibacter sp. XHP0401]